MLRIHGVESGWQYDLYNMYGEEINMYGGHEYVRVRTLGKLDGEGRDRFYSLLKVMVWASPL